MQIVKNQQEEIETLNSTILFREKEIQAFKENVQKISTIEKKNEELE